jgi:hypothetical protein
MAHKQPTRQAGRNIMQTIAGSRLGRLHVSIKDAVMVLFFGIYLGGKLQVRVEAT